MPSTCIVLGCRSRATPTDRDYDGVRFFRIPAVRNFVHQPDLNELSRIRLQKWLAAFKRSDLQESILRNQRVCSKHFISGKPADIEDTSNPDWVPSVNMGYPEYGKKRVSKENKRKIPNQKEKVQRKKNNTAKKAPILPDEPERVEAEPEQVMEAEPEKIEIITVVDDLCRICFENKLDMTPLSTVVCLGTTEPLALIESVQYLTGESDEQIKNPKYPNKICESCINLLAIAYEFKKKYEKTSQILNKICNVKTGEDDDDDIFDSEATLSAVQGDDGNFVEMDIVDDEDELLEILNKNDDTEDNEKTDDDMFNDKVNNIYETLDLLQARLDRKKKPVPEHKKLYKCPICRIKCTKLQLKQHASNHEELSSYIDRAPIYNKKIRFYVQPARIRKVANGKSNLNTHTCYLCKKKFKAAKFFKHLMSVHGFIV